MPFAPGKLFSRVEKMFTLNKQDRDYLTARKKRDKAAKDGHYGEPSKEKDEEKEAAEAPAGVMVPGKEYESERVEKIKVDKKGTVKEVKATEGNDRGTLPVPANVVIGRVPNTGSNFTSAYTEAGVSDEDPKIAEGEEPDIDTRLVTGDDSDEEEYKKTVTTKKKGKVTDLDKLDESDDEIEEYKSISDYEKKKEKDINKKAKDELAASKATKLKANYVKNPPALQSSDHADETIVTEEKKTKGSKTITPEAQAKAAAMKAALEKDVTRPARPKKVSEDMEEPGQPTPEGPKASPVKTSIKTPEKKSNKVPAGSPPKKAMKPVAPAMGLGLEKPGQVSSAGDEELEPTSHDLPAEKHVKTENLVLAKKKPSSRKAPSVRKETTEEDFEIKTSGEEDELADKPPPVPPRLPSSNETDEEKNVEEAHVTFKDEAPQNPHVTKEVTETKIQEHSRVGESGKELSKKRPMKGEHPNPEEAASSNPVDEENVGGSPSYVKPSTDGDQEIHGVNYTQIVCTKPGMRSTAGKEVPSRSDKPSSPDAQEPDPEESQRRAVCSPQPAGPAAERSSTERGSMSSRSQNERPPPRPQEQQEVVFE